MTGQRTSRFKAEQTFSPWTEGHGGTSRSDQFRKADPAEWTKPVRWNKAAQAAGVRIRVFCRGCDVFNPSAPAQWQTALWALIRETPYLDWILATEAPHTIARMLPSGWSNYANVWLGTIARTQAEANQRVPALLDVRARIHFVQLAPLLEAVDLTAIPYGEPIGNVQTSQDALAGKLWVPEGAWNRATDPRATINGRTYVDLCPRLDWVIVGGSTGPDAIPLVPEWVLALRDACTVTRVAFRFTHWGDWATASQIGADHPALIRVQSEIVHRGHQYLAEHIGRYAFGRIGSKAAGRLLDAQCHDDFPNRDALS